MTTQESYYYGTGKRKSAIARVRLYPGGTGTVIVNGKPLEEALPWIDWQKRAMQPFATISAAADRFNVVAKIEGGGVSAWADALRHGNRSRAAPCRPEPQEGSSAVTGT